MYDALIKDLRELQEFDHLRLGHVCGQGADAIEKLQQENDFLKGMLKQLVRGISNEELGQMVYRELRRGGHV